MLDTTIAMMANQALNYLASEKVPPRLGNEHPNIAPYQVFPTGDGNIIVACGSEQQFKKLCDIMERPDIPEDPRFTVNKERLAHREELVGVLNPIFTSKPSSYWLEQLELAGISCGPINNLEQTFADPHVKARGMRLEMDHPATGERPIALVASPIRMTETSVEYRHAPPLLGQHTDEVLSEVLEMSEADIDKLKAAGTV